jgi:hypothetical protein
VVFIVLFYFDLFHFSAGLVEGLPLEHTFIDLIVVGLDEKHVLFKHTDILEAA